MKPDFDYQLLPHSFIHCLNGQCKRADGCLRHQATLRIPPERGHLTIVNPAVAASAGEDCNYFKADSPKLFARGISRLLDCLPHKDAVIIKRQMLSYFGKTHFYRVFRKEVLLSEDQQEYIQQLFKLRSIKEAPVFDEYIEMYE